MSASMLQMKSWHGTVQSGLIQALGSDAQLFFPQDRGQVRQKDNRALMCRYEMHTQARF
jgi:hypothetical protein